MKGLEEGSLFYYEGAQENNTLYTNQMAGTLSDLSFLSLRAPSTVPGTSLVLNKDLELQFTMDPEFLATN